MADVFVLGLDDQSHGKVSGCEERKRNIMNRKKVKRSKEAAKIFVNLPRLFEECM